MERVRLVGMNVVEFRNGAIWRSAPPQFEPLRAWAEAEVAQNKSKGQWLLFFSQDSHFWLHNMKLNRQPRHRKEKRR
jgi:hypothetical protein